VDTHQAPSGATDRISVRTFEVDVDAPGEALTPREQAVLEQLARGLSAAAAGAETHHSAGTVRTHLKAAKRKLGALNTAHAVAIAIRQGLI
jgi:DNA-binding CsgD family transcriptional regulator